MQTLHFRKKPMAISRVNPLNLQLNRDNVSKNSSNNLSCDDRNFAHRKKDLLALDPNRHANSKSPYVNQSLTIATITRSFNKEATFLKIG